MARFSRISPRFTAALGSIAVFLTSAFVVAQQPRVEPPKLTAPRAKPKGTTEGETTTEVITKQAMVRPLVAPQPLNLAANADALTAQYTQQLRPILVAELRLLTSVTEPSPAQRKEIALAGGRALKLAAKSMAEIRMGLNNQGQAQAFPDPPRMIRDAVEAAAKAKLAPEPFDRYNKELVSRADYQKDVLIQNLVAKLDDLLFLSGEQRGQLSSFLRSHGDTNPLPSLENLTTYEAYYPILPDFVIIPILDQTQTKVWRNAQKLNFTSLRNFNFVNVNLNGNAAADGDADVDAALAEEVKK